MSIGSPRRHLASSDSGVEDPLKCPPSFSGPVLQEHPAVRVMPPPPTAYHLDFTSRLIFSFCSLRVAPFLHASTTPLEYTGTVICLKVPLLDTIISLSSVRPSPSTMTTPASRFILQTRPHDHQSYPTVSAKSLTRHSSYFQNRGILISLPW